MDASIENTVSDILKDKAPFDDFPEILPANLSLQELQLDSLCLLEAVYELEDHFEITVDDNLLASLHTVDDIVAMVRIALQKAA